MVATASRAVEAGTPMTGDDFYARTREIGFGYGDAFRAVTSIAAGAEWAVAEIDVPAEIVDELDAYHFHPALVDSAFQTLFGTRFVGADGQGTEGGTYLPTRIRHSALYGPPEKTMTVHVRVVSTTAEEIESDIAVVNALGEPLAVFDGFTVQSLQASSAMSRRM